MDYEKAFNDIMEMIDGGGAVYIDRIEEKYVRQYYENIGEEYIENDDGWIDE